MAQFSSVNNLPATGARAIQSLVDELVVTGVWSIYAWHDGTNRHIGNAAWTVAALDVSKSWVEITGPGGRGIGFMHASGGTNTNWWIRYYVNGFAAATNGGSGTFDSTGITEDKDVWGTNNTGVALFQADAGYRWSIVAYDGTGEWVAMAWQSVTANASAIVAFDHLTSLDGGASDVEPYVIVCQGAVTSTTVGNAIYWNGYYGGLVSNLSAQCWFGKTGVGQGTWAGVAAAGLYFGNYCPGGVYFVQNPLSSKDVIWQVWWSRQASWPAPNYSRGLSSLFSYLMTSRASSDTVSVTSSLDHVVFGNFAIVWPTGVTPLY